VYQELTLVPLITSAKTSTWAKSRSSVVPSTGISFTRHTADLDQIPSGYQPQPLSTSWGLARCQMTEIAKALSENARVLILDEPTSALTEARPKSSWRSCGRSKSMG